MQDDLTARTSGRNYFPLYFTISSGLFRNSSRTGDDPHDLNKNDPYSRTPRTRNTPSFSIGSHKDNFLIIYIIMICYCRFTLPLSSPDRQA